MSRSRRSSRAASPAAASAASASLDDAVAVVRITDAGVKAIVAAAAEYGLDGAPWDPDVLHNPIAKVVAHALRRSTEWWVDRTSEGS